MNLSSAAPGSGKNEGPLALPPVRLIQATLEHHDALHNLAQLYQYDFSEFLPGDVNRDGEYPYIDTSRYLTTSGFEAHLAYVERKLAGFILLTDQLTHRKSEGHYMSEFFVMRRFRRRGIGRSMAFQIFDRYRGYWEVAQVESNIPAQAFWRRIIGEYTGSRYQEVVTRDEEIGIVWQLFDNNRPA